jgi:hypothetical protein
LKDNIVTYEGFEWLIITGSGLGDWNFWHLQVATINDYNNLTGLHRFQ